MCLYIYNIYFSPPVHHPQFLIPVMISSVTCMDIVFLVLRSLQPTGLFQLQVKFYRQIGGFLIYLTIGLALRGT